MSLNATVENMMSVGVISELWRYPVKSMLGERCETVQVEARGVEGDRQFAILTADGKPGSGKSTRRFRKIDGLFRFKAHYRDQVPCIKFPAGEILEGDNPDIHHALSEALGQPVTFNQEGDISHLDAGPVHLITSASLHWLHSELPNASISVRRFRPNLVIELPGASPVEQAWLGRRLCIGKEVELLVSAATERCGMVAFMQSELPYEAGVLRHIAQHADGNFGVYAQVVVPGTVRLNDPVKLKNEEEI